MFALRFVSALALIVWLGGAIVVAGVVAPAAFGVLPSHEAANLVGETLRRFHVLGYVAGTTLLAALVGAALLGPRPVAFWARLWIATFMLAATLVSGLWVNRRVAALRQEAGAAAQTPGWRASFARWHRASGLLLMLTIGGGLVLVYWEARRGSDSDF